MREDLLAKRAADIRGMFGRIAHRYDLLNRLLSLGQDVRWRRAVAQRVGALNPDRVLDLCTGTGDLALALTADTTVVGADFCLPMLRLAQAKAEARPAELLLASADALQLPWPDHTFDVATVGFGIRNFERLDSGVRELARVLRPGGTLLVLEFSRPRGALGPLLGWWVRTVPPRIGRLLSGDREAYGYLTASVAEFPDGDVLCAVFEAAGLRPLVVRPLTGGVATLYEAQRMSAERVDVGGR